MLNLTEFILRNFRQVHWAVCQNGDVLAKGEGDIGEVCDTIKQTEIHIPTDEEIAAKQKKRMEEYNKQREARAKELKEKKLIASKSSSGRKLKNLLKKKKK